MQDPKSQTRARHPSSGPYNINDASTYIISKMKIIQIGQYGCRICKVQRINKYEKITYAIYAPTTDCPIMSNSNNEIKFSCKTNIVFTAPNTSASHGICTEAPVAFINVDACLYRTLYLLGTFFLNFTL